MEQDIKFLVALDVHKDSMRWGQLNQVARLPA